MDSVLPSATVVKMQVTRQKHKMHPVNGHTQFDGQRTTKVLKPTIESNQ